MGVSGGSLHVGFTDRSGRNLVNDTVDNSVSTQEIYGGGQTWQLTTLTYEQKLFGGMVDVEAGRTELGNFALQDPIYCQFQSNALCGEPDIMGKDINASFYPVAIWGGRVKVAPIDKTYLSVGLFDSDPTDSAPKYHGFNFSAAGSNGALIPVEAGYETTFANDSYPRRYDIGVVFDRTPYAYTTYNAATQSLGTTPAYGREMLYAQFRQMIYRPDLKSQCGLTVFGALIVGPDAGQPSDFDVTLGAVDLGPFAARPLDSLSAAIDLTHYRRAFVDQLAAYRLGALGGSQRPASSLVMGELNYNVAVTPWLNIVPNVQYIVHPDGQGALPYPKANLPNAWVLGLQFRVALK
jgi:porin